MSLFQEQAYKTDTGGQTEEIDRDEIVLQSEHTRQSIDSACAIHHHHHHHLFARRKYTQLQILNAIQEQDSKV